MCCEFFYFSKMSSTLTPARQIANAVSVLQKFAKKGMVGSAPAMDAKKKARKATGGKKPASKKPAKKTAGGKKAKKAGGKK